MSLQANAAALVWRSVPQRLSSFSRGSHKKLRPGSFLPGRNLNFITSEAPFGQIFFWDSDEKIVLSQRLFCVRIKPEYDARFIYYYMTTPEFQSELDGRATGTTVIGLRQPELMKCVIRCPEIQEQKVIAAILSSIDAKIIANEKVNDNLAA